MLVHVLSLLALAFAVSLDGFGVGFTYGLRSIRFPWWSLLVVVSLSMLTISFAMVVGQQLIYLLSPQGAHAAGAGILIVVGAWAIVNHVRNKNSSIEEDLDNESENTEVVSRVGTILHVEIKKLGLVVQILRKPSVADVDRSGEISVKEALLLGIALSMDGFGAGIGASLIGFPTLVTAVTIGGMNLLFILSGMKIGLKYADLDVLKKLSYLPGAVLILIGIAKMFS